MKIMSWLSHSPIGLFVWQFGAPSMYYSYNLLSIIWTNFFVQSHFEWIFHVFPLLVSIFLKSDHNAIPIELIGTSIRVLWTFFLILCFCELGEMVTKKFDIFKVLLVQCNWYLYPIEKQQIMLIFISYVQTPTIIRGHGNILCGRQTVKQVYKIIFYLPA